MPAETPAPTTSEMLKVGLPASERDDDAAESVADPRKEAATAEGVEACVLMRGSGNEELDHVVFGGLVDGHVPEVAAVTYFAGSGLRCGVAQVVIAHNRDRNGDCGVIEGVLSGSDEFLFDRLG
jgi:hypothetical protein